MTEEKTCVLFQPGDVIIPMTAPLVKVLSQSQKGRLCDHCFNPGLLSRCMGCQMMHYCGKECQKLDWKEGHSIECKSEVFRLAPSVSAGTLIDRNLIPKLLRTLAKRQLKPKAFRKKHAVFGTKERSCDDMMFHEEIAEVMRTPMASFLAKLYSNLKQDSSYGTGEFTEESLARIYGVWKTFCFVLFNKENVETGSALYIPHSALNNSCRPNALRVLRQAGQLEIRCIHPILKGEEPRISFLAGLPAAPEERRVALEMRYRFICKCELCKAEESGPLVNYDELTLLRGKLLCFTGLSHRSVTVIRDKGLSLHRKIFHEYDERTTNFCSLAFDVVYQWQMEFQNVPKTYIRKVAMDLEKRIQITFGKQSNDYVDFKRKLNALGFELHLRPGKKTD